MKFILILSLLILSACTNNKPGAWEGECVHPGIANGMPFEIQPGTTIDGTSISRNTSDGKEQVKATGVACILHRTLKK